MRKVLLLLAIVVAVFILWKFVFAKKEEKEEPKTEAIAVSKHSKGFNESIAATLNSYYTLTDAFVNWDSSKVNTQVNDLKQKLGTINLNELKKDSNAILATAQSFIVNAQGNTSDIEQSPSMEQKRRALNNLTDNLYNFLRTVKYDASKLYLQECPMAFNDTEAGQWLSKTEEIKNPYLGTHHPRYGKSMLSCGETKDTVNFTGK
jgi:murein L,D-transpeptidase YcbB/YkuD